MTREDATKILKAIRAVGVDCYRVGTGKNNEVALYGPGSAQAANALENRGGLKRCELSGDGSCKLKPIVMT